MTRYFHYTITIVGSGDDEQEAWEDAVLNFSLDPGSLPMDHQIEDVTDESEEAQ